MLHPQEPTANKEQNIINSMSIQVMLWKHHNGIQCFQRSYLFVLQRVEQPRWIQCGRQLLWNLLKRQTKAKTKLHKQYISTFPRELYQIQFRWKTFCSHENSSLLRLTSYIGVRCSTIVFFTINIMHMAARIFEIHIFFGDIWSRDLKIDYILFTGWYLLREKRY